MRQTIPVVLALAALGCATKRPADPSHPTGTTSAQQTAKPRAPAEVLAAAEAALADENPARAVVLFGQYLAMDSGDAAGQRQAFLGVARGHEQLRDCTAAVATLTSYLDRFPDAADAVTVHARRGACEAELGRWEASAASFAAVAQAPGELPSVTIEGLARQGYALFELGSLEDAERVLGRADEIFAKAEAEQSERFSSYYFVGMARFYRAAIIHSRFREVEIELPQQAMEIGFKKKLELLVAAQDAYNRTIGAKHMFWVSASGFQLGHLFGEFYDALMYAPVPEWLDERQRRIYYDELKKQLRPVITKAIWVFEKNLETARRLGYESPFIERTQIKLGHLQSVMRSTDANLGQPNPKLVAEADPGDVDPTAGPADAAAADRKLFVPKPTYL